MFETLLSNNRMKKELELAVNSKKPMHAYLFCGAEGSGKFTAAMLLAEQLVGKNSDKVSRGSHPDIFVLEPEKDKKTITVKQVRDMRNDSFVNPSEGLRKIYIIKGVHLMQDTAQNALLTILEQPPSFATFILLSESREKVLATVVSRCAVFEMEYVEAEDGAKLLQNEFPAIAYEKLVAAMHAADGNIGFAKKLATSEDFEKSKELCLKISLAIADKDAYALAKIITVLSKDELLSLLPILSIFLKDIAVYKTTRTDKLVFKESILQNKLLFDKIDVNTLYDGVAECEKSISLIHANVSCQLISAALVIRLCGGKQID